MEAQMYKKLFLAALVTFVGFVAEAREEYGNLLDCKVQDLTKESTSGQTLLEFIRKTVKPQLDTYAIKGYSIVDGDRLVEVLDLVDSKVRRQALSSVKGRSNKEKLANLKKIGDQLAGEKGSVYTTHDILAKTGLVSDRYKLSTYVGLASCAGSHLKLADDNYAYNVHYGTGKEDKDDRTGRSFGASRKYRATDSSYSHYLRELEKFITQTPNNSEAFNKTVMETLTNTQSRAYEQVNDQGDAVLTDFIAIWIAEQDRNLMDGRVSPHWDAALFQTTLLATSFHAGQKKIKMFYEDPLSGKRYFTDVTYELAWPRKNHGEEKCEVDLESRKEKDASLTDYIGVHYRTYEHCGRSGVNMSRDEWRLLGSEITRFMSESAEGKKLLAAVRKHTSAQVKPSSRNADIYRELASFLINDKTPGKLNNWEDMSASVVAMLKYVQDNAEAITARLEKKYDGLN